MESHHNTPTRRPSRQILANLRSNWLWLSIPSFEPRRINARLLDSLDVAAACCCCCGAFEQLLRFYSSGVGHSPPLPSALPGVCSNWRGFLLGAQLELWGWRGSPSLREVVRRCEGEARALSAMNAPMSYRHDQQCFPCLIERYGNVGAEVAHPPTSTRVSRSPCRLARRRAEPGPTTGRHSHANARGRPTSLLLPKIEPSKPISHRCPLHSTRFLRFRSHPTFLPRQLQC